MDVAGVANRAANPLAGLLQGGVGEADDREPGQSARYVDLDPDHPPVEADERGGQQRGKHAATVPASARRRITLRLAATYLSPAVPRERRPTAPPPSPPAPPAACRRSGRSPAVTGRAANRPW